MRYNGRYALEHRLASYTTQDKKYPFATVNYQQGETRVEISLLATTTPVAPTVYFPQDATTLASDTRQHIQQALGHYLAEICTKISVHPFMFEVVLTIHQADGSLLAACLNALYLVCKQAEVKSSMAALNPFVLVDDFAAVTLAYRDNEMIVDPDAIEEQEATFRLTLVMYKDGQFVDWVNHSAEAFVIDRMNESFSLGQAAIESLLADFMIEIPAIAQLKQDRTIMIATNNQGKAKEFAALFEQAGYQIKTLADFPEIPEVAETGQTFAENACLKAETIAATLNIPVLADDSGLKVDALNGLPGVYSARFAGLQKSDAANNAKLLHELTDVPDEKRTAQFHCTLAFAAPAHETLVVSAEWPGVIGRIPRGDNGFGYDPLFFVPDLEKTAAELTGAEKNAISHRGQAMKKLAEVWQTWLEGEQI